MCRCLCASNRCVSMGPTKINNENKSSTCCLRLPFLSFHCSTVSRHDRIFSHFSLSRRFLWVFLFFLSFILIPFVRWFRFRYKRARPSIRYSTIRKQRTPIRIVNFRFASSSSAEQNYGSNEKDGHQTKCAAAKVAVKWSVAK